MIIFSHAKSAEGAKILSPFLFTLALEESQTSLRREGAESLSTPSSFGGCPHVAMGIATLIGHRMTSSHSSKDPLLPPFSGGELEGVRVRFNV